MAWLTTTRVFALTKEQAGPENGIYNDPAFSKPAQDVHAEFKPTCVQIRSQRELLSNNSAAAAPSIQQ